LQEPCWRWYLSPLACLYDLLQPGFGHRNGLARSKDEAGRERPDEETDDTDPCREGPSPMEGAVLVGVDGDGAREVWGVLLLLSSAGGRQALLLLLWRECKLVLSGLIVCSLEVIVPGSMALNSVYSA